MVRQESYGAIAGFKSIIFGDDNFATIIDEKTPKKDNQGIWMKKFLIVPSAHLIKDYPWLLKEGKMSNTPYGQAIWVEYPYDLINDKNTSRTNAIVRVYCAFDGSETSETERHKFYTERIKDLQKECNHLKESNAYYLEAYNQALGTIKGVMGELAEINNIVAKSGGKSDDEENE